MDVDSIIRTLKLVITLGLTLGLVFCLRTCMNFYLKYPTYTDIHMVDQQDAFFPAVTFCPYPDSKNRLKEIILKVI